MSWEALQYSVAVCRGIKAQDRAVLTAIAYHTKSETPYLAFCSQRRIAEWCDMAKSTAKACLRRLQRAGELEMVNIGGIGRDKEHLATDWRLPGVERWVRLGAKADTSGVRTRPQRGQNPIPGRGQDPIPIKDIDRIKIEDEDAASPLSPSSLIEKEGSEQNNAQYSSLPLSESVSQSRSSLNGSKTSKKLKQGSANDNKLSRRREIANAYAGDDAAWREFLETVPELEGKDIESVINKYRNRCRNDGYAPNRMELVGWLMNEGQRVNFDKMTKNKPRQSPVVCEEVRTLISMYKHAVQLMDEGEDPVAYFAETPFSGYDFTPEGIRRVCVLHDLKMPSAWTTGADDDRASHWTGEADAEAFAAEMAPQLAATGT